MRKHIAYPKVLLTWLSCVMYFFAASQNEILKLKCNLKDEETLKKINNVMIQVFQNGTEFDTEDTGTSGKAEMTLPLGFTYDIKFTRADYVSKIIRFDTRNIPQEDKAGGFQTDLDVSLFTMIDGFNLDIMKEPIGKASFDSQKNTIEFDFAYTKAMTDKIKAEKKRLAGLAKNEEKFKKEYEKLMSEGDAAMGTKKYADAMEKYDGALKIFPKDVPAKKKYDEAKSARDAELAAQQTEVAYNKLLADGEENIKAKKWNNAKKNFQEASKLKPAEKLPKEKLYEIDQLIKMEKLRSQYDPIIADADAKFNSKNYAVSIERYKDALKLLPDESYPKDQITKAQSIMDMLMADEAKRQQIERDYKNQITLGDKNLKDKNYEPALNNYREAARIKPDEDYPDKKIREIEKIMSDLQTKKEQESSIASAEEERKRIEKEYNEHILAADKYYKESKQKDIDLLENAKGEYGAALDLKNNEKYPKAQVTAIENLIASINNKKNNDIEGEAKRLEQERKNQDREMQQQKDEQKKLAEEQRQKRIEEEEAKRKKRDELLAKAKKNDENRSKFLATDRSKEDEVDAYYREAKEIEEAAKYTAMKERKETYDNYHLQKETASDVDIKEKLDNINSQKDQLIRIEKNGNTLIEQNTAKLDTSKKQNDQNNAAYRIKSDTRQKQSEEKVNREKESQNKLSELNRHQQKQLAIQKQKQEQYADKEKAWDSRGNAVRTTHIAEVKREKENQQQLAFDGEKIRQENIQNTHTRKEEIVNFNKDIQSAAEVRLASSKTISEQKKEAADEYGKGKDALIADKIIDINKKKQRDEMLWLEKDTESSGKRYEARQALLEKNPGYEKNADEYRQIPGTDGLPEGVTETSYEYGKNKKIIERTVKRGNKIDTYRKVVSKTGIYYFKNDQSITEQMWIQETLQSKE